MAQPVLDDQLFGVRPTAKLTLGFLLSIAGAGATVVLWHRGWIFGIPVFATLMGAMSICTGQAELRRARRFHAEVARAQDEWSTLQREVAATRGSGESVARMLQQRGYREFAVRRWIQQELGGGPTEER